MVNQELKEALNNKIQRGEFSAVDIPNYLKLFCALGNEVEDLQQEVKDWNRRISFVMDGLGAFWMTIKNGRFAMGEGPIQEPNLILTLAADEAAKIFPGDGDAQAAFMSGALKIEGEFPDALKFQTLIEIVADEIEY